MIKRVACRRLITWPSEKIIYFTFHQIGLNLLLEIGISAKTYLDLQLKKLQASTDDQHLKNQI
jgi:hypothetical protein